MPDPDYKPPPSENANSKKSFMDMKGGPGGGSLRDIRLQQKPGRRKANSDEPECIALSSDEDEGDEENDGNFHFSTRIKKTSSKRISNSKREFKD